jgi:hypothetical protein
LGAIAIGATALPQPPGQRRKAPIITAPQAFIESSRNHPRAIVRRRVPDP